MVPAGLPSRQPCPPMTGKREGQVPTQTRLALGILSPTADVAQNSSMKGAQTPRLGLRSTPAQPVPSDSKYLLNLWELDQRRPSGSGPRPTWLQGLCLFLQCVPIPFPPCPQEGRLSRKSQLLMWFLLL